MDELTMPKPRASIAPPVQLRGRAEGAPIPLAEFAVARAVELPALELYTAVAHDLGAWIEESKKICVQAERETEKVTPELFKEFAASDESEQAILLVCALLVLCETTVC